LRIRAVIETAVYADDLEAAAAFYGAVLHLPILAKEPERHVFFQVGDNQVLLVFRAEATRNGDVLPPHGANGPGHFALGIDVDSLDAWKNLLQRHAIAIEKEVTWPRGGKSLYFRDPAGNLVELVTPGIWGLPTGW
jgi:catechol 2,3-dioxygenase-like lactoylglutathione lyase family enzyme